MTGWPPPPINFPEKVDNARAYFDAQFREILDRPPLLDEKALRESCEGLAADTMERLRRGQDALKAGEISKANYELAPIVSSHPHAAVLSGLACYALGRVARAVYLWDMLSRVFDLQNPPNLYSSFINLGHAIMKQDNSISPEADAMRVICDGKGIDVGCGGNKTCPEAIGVDLTVGGADGVHGGQQQVVSKADIASSGDRLPMFADAELDYVIARHNLEHYQDYVKTLLEWTRVLKPGGLMGIIAPDHKWVDTIALDSTHYHVFTIESLRNLFGLLPDLDLVHAGVMVPRWSILALVQKTPADSRYDFHSSINSREVKRVLGRMDVYEKEGATKLMAECLAEAKWLKSCESAGEIL